MLNSNQIRTKLFVRADLDKLTKQRLKAFKQSCEARQSGFIDSCDCDTSCYSYHVKNNPEQFNSDTVNEYRIWSTNMKTIREALEAKKV